MRKSTQRVEPAVVRKIWTKPEIRELVMTDEILQLFRDKGPIRLPVGGVRSNDR